MRKIWLAVVLVAALGLFGCKADTAQEETGKTKETEWMKDSDSEEEEAGTAGESAAAGPEKVSGAVYYKMAVKEGGMDPSDAMDIIQAILANEIDREKLDRDTQVSTDEGVQQYTISIDGIDHTWWLTGWELTYSDRGRDRDENPVDAQSAREQADAFIERLGLPDLLAEPVSEVRASIASFRYLFQYEGVELVGEKAISFTDDPDEKDLHGAYIRVDVDANGICSVLMSRMPPVEEILESYTEEDFIGEERARTIAREELDYFEFEGEIQTFGIKYMPFREVNGRENLWIPVYSAQGVFTVMGAATNTEILIDAQTGLVYSFGP